MIFSLNSTWSTAATRNTWPRLLLKSPGRNKTTKTIKSIYAMMPSITIYESNVIQGGGVFMEICIFLYQRYHTGVGFLFHYEIKH